MKKVLTATIYPDKTLGMNRLAAGAMFMDEKVPTWCSDHQKMFDELESDQKFIATPTEKRSIRMMNYNLKRKLRAWELSPDTSSYEAKIIHIFPDDYFELAIKKRPVTQSHGPCLFLSHSDNILDLLREFEAFLAGYNLTRDDGESTCE